MKTAVLLSGGVDSSVALRLLQDEGTENLEAFYIKIWLEDELAYLGDCPWEADLEFARAVCDSAHVPLHIIPLQAEYQQIIVDYALAELRAGRTPSPDILCNQFIKFGAFYDAIDDEYEAVATGHYAQIENCDGTVRLKRSPDPVKDQTYFLYRLNQTQLVRARFPIGQYTKSQVRDLAEQFELPNMMRRDSQGLCFLGKIKYDDFVKFHLGEQAGNIVEIETDTILGTHLGHWLYTIGQRQGLGLSGGPWYVVRKELNTNIVYVSHQDNYRELARNEFVIDNVHWIADAPNVTELNLKIRHGPTMIPCTIEFLDVGKIQVRMADSDCGVASGQSAILYDDVYCLGGGTIV